MQIPMPAWNPDDSQKCAQQAIAVQLGIHFIRDLTDIGEMERYILSRLDALKDSVVRCFLRDCPPEMLDAIDIELSRVSIDTPRDDELVRMAADRGTSWRYRYDALHPFFVEVCSDLRVRLARARTLTPTPADGTVTS